MRIYIIDPNQGSSSGSSVSLQYLGNLQEVMNDVTTRTTGIVPLLDQPLVAKKIRFIIEGYSNNYPITISVYKGNTQILTQNATINTGKQMFIINIPTAQQNVATTEDIYLAIDDGGAVNYALWGAPQLYGNF